MARNKLLLVEDDPNLGTILSEYLQVKGYDVVHVTDGEAGWEAFQAQTPDVCILDVMMPRKDGFSLARDIRGLDQQVPILFLTARNMIQDKAEGFQLGGDDYLTKPFSMEELLLRIGALLRRQGATAPAAADRYVLGKFTFHPSTRMLETEGSSKRLTTRESELLQLLCEHMNQLLTREHALKEIWGDDSYFNARSMDVFITKLRKYLRSDPRLEIMNVHGTGYKLICP